VLQINCGVIASGTTRIHRRGEYLGDHGQHGGRGIHPAEESGMAVSHGVRQYPLRQQAQDFVPREWLGRERHVHEHLPLSLLHPLKNRTVRQLGKVAGSQIHGPVTQSPEFLFT
jgi:hypothetical protein